MHPSRSWGLSAALGGLALIGALLLGSVSTTTRNYWGHWAVLVALAIAAVLLFVGILALGSVYFGWPWPKTYEERQAERAQHEYEALMAHYARRDALQELHDELTSNRRDLGAELVNERVYGVYFPETAWEKNRNVLNGPERANERAAVHDAYLKTHALNLRTRERYQDASHDDVNSAEWVRLTDEERQQREEALDTVETALAALSAVVTRETQP